MKTKPLWMFRLMFGLDHTAAVARTSDGSMCVLRFWKCHGVLSNELSSNQQGFFSIFFTYFMIF